MRLDLAHDALKVFTQGTLALIKVPKARFHVAQSVPQEYDVGFNLLVLLHVKQTRLVLQGRGGMLEAVHRRPGDANAFVLNPARFAQAGLQQVVCLDKIGDGRCALFLVDALQCVLQEAIHVAGKDVWQDDICPRAGMPERRSARRDCFCGGNGAGRRWRHLLLNYIQIVSVSFL
jgi:hypothetical protein